MKRYHVLTMQLPNPQSLSTWNRPNLIGAQPWHPTAQGFLSLGREIQASHGYLMAKKWKENIGRHLLLLLLLLLSLLSFMISFVFFFYRSIWFPKFLNRLLSAVFNLLWCNDCKSFQHELECRNAKKTCSNAFPCLTLPSMPKHLFLRPQNPRLASVRPMPNGTGTLRDPSPSTVSSCQTHQGTWQVDLKGPNEIEICRLGDTNLLGRSEV